MKRILIAEDINENRLILAAILEDTYIVDVAENGREALDILQKGEKPALVMSSAIKILFIVFLPLPPLHISRRS